MASNTFTIQFAYGGRIPERNRTAETITDEFHKNMGTKRRLDLLHPTVKTAQRGTTLTFSLTPNDMSFLAQREVFSKITRKGSVFAFPNTTINRNLTTVVMNCYECSQDKI